MQNPIYCRAKSIKIHNTIFCTSPAPAAVTGHGKLTGIVSPPMAAPGAGPERSRSGRLKFLLTGQTRFAILRPISNPKPLMGKIRSETVFQRVRGGVSRMDAAAASGPQRAKRNTGAARGVSRDGRPPLPVQDVLASVEVGAFSRQARWHRRFFQPVLEEFSSGTGFLFFPEGEAQQWMTALKFTI